MLSQRPLLFVGAIRPEDDRGGCDQEDTISCLENEDNILHHYVVNIKATLGRPVQLPASSEIKQLN